MSELGSLLRQHYEEIAPPIDVDRLSDRLLTEERLRPRSGRGVLVALAAAVIVLLLVGGTTALLLLTRAGDQPAVDQVTTTTVPEDTTTERPPDEGALPSTFDVGLPFTVLDSAGDVGSAASVVVGSDGTPLVAYLYHPLDTRQPSEVRIAACGDPACAETGEVRVVAEVMAPPGSPEEGRNIYADIEALLPRDGLPIIIWSEWEEVEEGGESHLRAYKCQDAQCSDGTLSEIDSQETSGLWASVGPDSRPVIVRRIGETLELTKCGDPSCSASVQSQTPSLPSIGWNPSVAVDDASLPVLAFSLSGDGTAGEGPVTSTLGVARCTDELCDREPSVHDLGIPIQSVIGVTVGSNDVPVILVVSAAQEGAPPDTMSIVTCSDSSCTGDPVVTALTDSSSGFELDDPSSVTFEVAEDGSVTALQARGSVRVLSCTDSTCSGGVTAVDLIPGLSWAEVDLAITPDGLPAIAIHANTDVGMLVCSEPTCVSSAIAPLPDTPDSDWASSTVAVADVQLSGTNPSVEIGPSGYPVVAYLGTGRERGAEGQDVAVPKLLVCNDAQCSDPTIREFSGEALWVDMSLMPDGRPVVLYSAWTADWEMQEMYLAWCSDPECTSSTPELVTSDTYLNPATAMTTQPDGSVTIVFQDGNYYTNVVTCAEGSCVASTPVRVDSLVEPNENEWGLRWWMNSVDVAIVGDGRPAILAAQTNGELAFVECVDRGCSRSSVTVIDTTLPDTTGSLVIGPNGQPLIAYYDDGALTAVTCADSSCSDVTSSSLGIASAAGTASVTPSIAFGNDGSPMIAYWAPRALMIAQCSDSSCSGAGVDVFADVRTYDLTVLPDGRPVVVYFAYSAEERQPANVEFGPLVDLRIATCLRDTCMGD